MVNPTAQKPMMLNHMREACRPRPLQYKQPHSHWTGSDTDYSPPIITLVNSMVRVLVITPVNTVAITLVNVLVNTVVSILRPILWSMYGQRRCEYTAQHLLGTA